MAINKLKFTFLLIGIFLLILACFLFINKSQEVKDYQPIVVSSHMTSTLMAQEGIALDVAKSISDKPIKVFSDKEIANAS